MNFLKSTIAGMAVAVITAGNAFAGVFPVTATDPSVSATPVDVDIVNLGSSIDLFGLFDISSSSGIMPNGLAAGDFLLTLDTVDPSFSFGDFTIDDDDGLFLSGDLSDFTTSDDLIEVLFENVNGSAAGDFGSSVLASIAFNSAVGDPLGLDGIFDATVTFSAVDTGVAPIPLPAALPMLAGGLGLIGFVGMRRKRKATAA